LQNPIAHNALPSSTRRHVRRGRKGRRSSFISWSPQQLKELSFVFKQILWAPWRKDLRHLAFLRRRRLQRTRDIAPIVNLRLCTYKISIEAGYCAETSQQYYIQTTVALEPVWHFVRTKRSRPAAKLSHENEYRAQSTLNSGRFDRLRDAL
jgi:hypothetical protein